MKRGWLRTLGALAVLALGIGIAYSRTFSVPFLADDAATILDNPTIRHLRDWRTALAPPAGALDQGRPLVNLSFACNFAFGGFRVSGYHAFNLAIHLASAWVVLLLCRRTFRRPQFPDAVRRAALPLAAAVAALWAWHPVQTEAVTYITQRCESMMALFYLLAVYGFVRGAESPSRSPARRMWFAAAIIAGLAAVATKEVAVTLPVAVWLYDRTFLSGSFRAALRRNAMGYLGLALSWVLLLALVSDFRDRGAGAGTGVPRLLYAAFEAHGILHYLRLMFWPAGLVFDYGLFAPLPARAGLEAMLALALLLAGTATALWRRPLLGFPVALALLLLAPTSSLVPLAGQPLAEHRLYLPLLPIAAGVVIAGFTWLGRRAYPVFALTAVALLVGTWGRNRAYASEISIWEDTVAKTPANTRALGNLAHAYVTAGRPMEGVRLYQRALTVDPNLPELYDSLGYAWLAAGQPDAAVAPLALALRLKPGFFDAERNLGFAELRRRHPEAAAEHLRRAASLRPRDEEAWAYLGAAEMALAAAGGSPAALERAIAAFERAISLDPGNADDRYRLAVAHNDFAVVCAREHRLDEARAHWMQAAALAPDYPDPKKNLALLARLRR